MFFAPSRKLAARRRREGGHRIYDPRERALLGLFDAFLRVASPIAGLRPARPVGEPSRARRILALRLDRIGDFVTTLPALECLRAAAPEAHIELGVGSWNEPIARRLPFVDAVRVVDAPWASWEKRTSFGDTRRALGSDWDLALDFQGDVRVILLMALAGARLRAGYGETGGAHLLTHRACWDESRSWYWQNLELLRTLFPETDFEPPARPFAFLSEVDRETARGVLDTGAHPLIGIHPSAGRRLKQWEEPKFVALIDRLAETAEIVLTGSSGDEALVRGIAAKTRKPPRVLLGMPLMTFAAVIERFDVFVTGDTGPMHLSHAVGTRNVAIFGPSDPVRYGPETEHPLRRVVRQPLYCSPCNMIRRPPGECAQAPAPECIASVGVEQVLQAVQFCLNVR
ncbi:MAG TPA: glycosyltransferase family 9 protein [Vicinamibacteria bacterium]|nr:glycosyltransferase family 9 protein [Vicinamibacteria bacterium]